MNEKRRMWLFNCGALIGLTTLSIALGSVPKKSQVTDDTALYQSLSEIQVPKAKDYNPETDISSLSQMEGKYRENLPALSKDPRLAGPMQRISQQKYVPAKKGTPVSTLQ